MAKAFIDGLIDDHEYNRQKRLLEMHLESLAVPEVDAAKEAGELIHNLPAIWHDATEGERRKLILTMLDAVYVDAKKTKSIIAIKPKPPFLPIFQVASTRAGADIRIVNEPLNPASKSSSVLLVETGEAPSPNIQILYLVAS